MGYAHTQVHSTCITVFMWRSKVKSQHSLLPFLFVDEIFKHGGKSLYLLNFIRQPSSIFYDRNFYIFILFMSVFFYESKILGLF